MTEREKIEAIDARVGHVAGQFRRVENLLTELFERQMGLEELVREQQELLQTWMTDILEGDGYDHPMVARLKELEQRTDAVLAHSVK